jgi:gas vesicle protein
MAQEPDRIRQDIEATRAELTRNVDALADRTVPSRVINRRWTGMKDKARALSDKVMGTPNGGAKASVGNAVESIQDAASRAGDKAGEVISGAADTVRQAPAAVAHGTQGNPLAAGMIAFGVGLLTASLIPATEMEKRAGQRIKDNADTVLEPIREPLAESAEQIKEDMTGSATVALDEIKETAKDAAQTTKEQATSSAEDAVQKAKRATKGGS